MILQALKQYYDRKVADPDSDLAPLGWERKEIRFVITLDTKGVPVQLEDTEEIVNKKKRSRTFLVPQSVKRTVNPVANILWDNAAYALGLVLKGEEKEKVSTKFATFKGAVVALNLELDEGVNAILRFLERENPAEALSGFPVYLELEKSPAANISFCLLNDDVPLICRRTAVVREIDARFNGAGETSRCLLSGKMDEISETHAAIKGVWGAQTAGANIVSFNAAAFRSYGKDQGQNAPIGKKAEFSYTTALNHLLGKDSLQRMQVGNVSTVFWSDKKTDFESEFASFFVEPAKDNPDAHVQAVRSLLEAPRMGVMSEGDDKIIFFVLGLAPNAARIAIAFWYASPLEEMKEHIRAHFKDMQMVHGPKSPDGLSLYRIFKAISPLNKIENIPDKLASDFMRAILSGGSYPYSLLQNAILRTKTEHSVPYERAALIKACLNRIQRFRKQHNTEELTMSLDKNSQNIGYRMGRLFATLEKIQEDANPGLNSTIRDRYYASASSTPGMVFGRLMALKNHHLAKLPKGQAVVREQLLGEIINGIQDFPMHLVLEDQGRFAVGYYHQRQDFFTKKDTTQQPEQE